MNPEAKQPLVAIAALEFLSAGINVVPVAHDGTKKPEGSWKHYQSHMNDFQTVLGWAGTADGFGIVTGAISGNLEMLELEGRAVQAGVLADASALASATDCSELWQRLSETYMETTPSGGIHWLYRLELGDAPMPGNRKIASQPGTNGNPEVFIETRGEGGFVIVAPSAGSIHPSGGSWERIGDSGPAKIATFTLAERDKLFAMLTHFDTMPKPADIERIVTPKDESQGLSPGDDFNQRMNWATLLEPYGWKFLFTDRGGQSFWERPGKDLRAISASTNHNGSDCLFVFSSSTVFDQQQPYSKFAAYTLLTQGSTSTTAFSNAAKQLRLEGYGQVHLASVSELREFVPQFDQATGEIIDEFDAGDRGQALMLAAEIQVQRVRKLAREHLRNEENLAKFKLPEIFDNLTIELQQPDEEAQYLINELFPTGANISLTAEYKSGKTTMVNNIVKSLIDNEPFLGRYGINDHDRNIVIFNYEVEPRQYRQWLREVGIKRTDRVKLVHLRGLRMPMTSEFVQERVIEILRDFDAQTWIVDPLARAFVGSGDENSNSDMGTFLDTLDVIKHEANVENLIVVAHTGRSNELGIERARGASRFDDWADVRWLLAKNDQGQRFLKASGRDVEMPEHLLEYNPETRLLTVDKAIKRADQTVQNIMNAMLLAVAAKPGMNTTELKSAVEGGTDGKNKAYKYLLDGGQIVAHKPSETSSLRLHYVPNHPVITSHLAV